MSPTLINEVSTRRHGHRGVLAWATSNTRSTGVGWLRQKRIRTGRGALITCASAPASNFAARREKKIKGDKRGQTDNYKVGPRGRADIEEITRAWWRFGDTCDVKTQRDVTPRATLGCVKSFRQTGRCGRANHSNALRLR